MGVAVLEFETLSKKFGTLAAVDGVSLSIPDGQMVGVIGRSGAGKSTLLRLVNRLETPTAGRLAHRGTEIGTLSGRALLDWRARCAMIFQQFNLVPRLDVITNVLLGGIRRKGSLAALCGHFSQTERVRAVLALDRLDLADHALMRVETLSGGQQQRVAIARALMQNPDILLADEPIASLDPRNASVVMEALRTINREDGITVLCNLHTLDTARRFCDRIVGMAAGRVVFDGRPEELRADVVRSIYATASDAIDETVTSVEAWPAPRVAAAAVA